MIGGPSKDWRGSGREVGGVVGVVFDWKYRKGDVNRGG